MGFQSWMNELNDKDQENLKNLLISQHIEKRKKNETNQRWRNFQFNGETAAEQIE